MFRGSSFHTIDSKRRMIIPARFRDVIKAGGGDGVMMTRMDSSLFAYTYEEWKKIEGKILSLAEKSDAMRLFQKGLHRWCIRMQLRQAGAYFAAPYPEALCGGEKGDCACRRSGSL